MQFIYKIQIMILTVPDGTRNIIDQIYRPIKINQISVGGAMGSIPNKITGGCHCGAIRYEARTPPGTGLLCHCRDCQRSTGSAFEALATFPQDELEFIKGNPKLYRPSAIMEKGFCPDCGSQLYDRYIVRISEDCREDMMWVHIGTLDHPEIASIEMHTGVESQLSWVHFDDELPRMRCDENPDLAVAFAAAQAGAG